MEYYPNPIPASRTEPFACVHLAGVDLGLADTNITEVKILVEA
jgi:hypothetical protein